MRITIKGQVTIPREIRESSGMLPGTDVEFIHCGEDVIVRLKKSRKEHLDAVIERSRGTATTGLTTDEVMSITRGEQ